MDTNQIQQNNTNKGEQIALERLKELPKVIQDAILYSRWQDILKDLSKQYGLRIDQGVMLENMVLSMLLGMTNVDEFVNFMKADLAMPENKAIDLFKDIDFKIFTNIYEKVRAIDAAANPEEKKINEDDLTMIDLSDDMIAKASNEFKINKMVKDDREADSYHNEILTVTRDEILKGVENPEQIKAPEDNLPSLSGMNVMSNQIINKPTSQPIVNNVPTNTNSVPEIKPIQTSDTTPVPINPLQSNPINPVEAGLGNKVSTSIKGFSASDPYRESIQ
jgi:hypothetical protein